MKKVFVEGYTENNLGDDLFFLLLVKEFPKVRFLFKSTKLSFLKKEKNVSVVSNKFLLFANRVFRGLFHKDLLFSLIMSRVDAYLLIGGSVFMEKNKSDRIFNHRKSILSYDNTKKIIIGSNFGPYKNELFLNQYRNLFGQFDWVCFRDNYSYGMFKELSQVSYAPDIVFLYNHEKSIKKTDDVIAISLMKTDRFLNTLGERLDFQKSLNALLNELVRQNKKIMLVNFSQEQGDADYARIIFDENPNLKNSMKMLTYNGYNMSEVLDCLASASYIISMRYHAMILGWNFGIPVFPIVYSQKTLNVIKDLGFDGNFCSVEEFSSKSFEFICRNYNENILLPNLDLVKKDAKRHFSYLDGFCK